MGGGTYSATNSTAREVRYSKMESKEIFTKRSIDNKMNPAGTMRECCDSVEHPETIPVIIALDVTGSMGMIPENFIKESMSKMMASLYKDGFKDSQVLFMGIGDHECDRSPLQVGQFEADDQKLDQWLKDIYLEGGGGGNDGESYLLAWYYAAFHTKIDSFDKRGKKGFLFTIGDEPTLKNLPKDAQERIFGVNGQYSDITADELLAKAEEKYNVYHIHVKETRNGSLLSVQDGWKQLLKNNAIMNPSYLNIPGIISDIISGSVGVGNVEPETLNKPIETSEVKVEEEIL